VTLETDELGLVTVTSVDPPRPGERVQFTVRPEKLRIAQDPRSVDGREVNSVSGAIDEPIYLGFQSKFFVKLDSGYIMRVFKQHTKYLDEGPAIKWKDRVRVTWSAEDGYIIPSR